MSTDSPKPSLLSNAICTKPNELGHVCTCIVNAMYETNTMYLNFFISYRIPTKIASKTLVKQ